MIIIGIDPGVSGAIAKVWFQTDRTEVQIVDLPTMDVGKKGATKNVLDVRATAGILRAMRGTTVDTIFLLESIPLGPAMRRAPKRGEGYPIPGAPSDEDGQTGQSLVTITRQFYLGGQIEGILAAIGARYEIVNPQVWKRAMMPGEAREKDAARQKALQLFPQAAEELKLKKHHNRGEALLLCEWGRRRG